MTRDYCEKCHGFVPTTELEPVLTCKQSHSSPAEYEEWCRACRGWDTRDADYERAASRAVSDDFEATNGRDWR